VTTTPTYTPNSTSSLLTAPKTVTSTTRTTTPTFQPGGQGMSAGPSMLGEPRIALGYLVNRVAPDLNGDGFPDITKVKPHH
jgi:hypothetical protein